MDSRFCQDRIYAPHVTIYIVIFLPEIPCIHRVGQNHIYTVYIRYFGREITKYTVIYGVYIRFWPTLKRCVAHRMGAPQPAHDTRRHTNKPSHNTQKHTNIHTHTYTHSCSVRGTANWFSVLSSSIGHGTHIQTHVHIHTTIHLYSTHTYRHSHTRAAALSHTHTHTHTHTYIHLLRQGCSKLLQRVEQPQVLRHGHAHIHRHTLIFTHTCVQQHTHTPTHTCSVRGAANCFSVLCSRISYGTHTQTHTYTQTHLHTPAPSGVQQTASACRPAA